MKIYETESQALAAQTNCSDVERLTEGTVGNAIRESACRGDAKQHKRWRQASVIDILVLSSRFTTTRIVSGRHAQLAQFFPGIYLAVCDRRCA